MKTIKQTYFINSSLEEVWKALTDPKYIDAWGAGPCKMDGKIGTKFELWGADIYGKNIEIIPLKKIKQEWFGGKWDNPSIVTFTLKKEDGKVLIGLLHADVPDNEANDIDQGWKEYYLGPLKEYLEKK